MTYNGAFIQNTPIVLGKSGAGVHMIFHRLFHHALALTLIHSPDAPGSLSLLTRQPLRDPPPGAGRLLRRSPEPRLSRDTGGATARAGRSGDRDTRASGFTRAPTRAAGPVPPLPGTPPRHKRAIRNNCLVVRRAWRFPRRTTGVPIGTLLNRTRGAIRKEQAG